MSNYDEIRSLERKIKSIEQIVGHVRFFLVLLLSVFGAGGTCVYLGVTYGPAGLGCLALALAVGGALGTWLRWRYLRRQLTVARVTDRIGG